MLTTTGSLVIIGANTTERKVFWNGQEVPCIGLVVDNDALRQKVVIEVAEDPTFAEMQAAGIIIRRVAA
jgi:hypothetical protein